MKMLQSLFLLGSVLGATAARADADMAAAFGARENVQQASLSPDGTLLAYLAPMQGQANALMVVRLDGSAVPTQALIANGKPDRLTDCRWVSNARLTCLVYQNAAGAGFVRDASLLVAVNADGTQQKSLTRRQGMTRQYTTGFGGAVVDWLPGQDGAVLLGRNYVPEGITGRIIEKRAQGYGVDRVDTLTLVAKPVVGAVPNALDYISDGLGTVRIMGVAQTAGTGSTTGVVRYLYRKAGSNGWEALGDYKKLTRQGFVPFAVDPAENVVYGSKRTNGRAALYKVALDGSMTETMVFQHPTVDVDGPLTLGRKQRVIGVTYATDKREAVYFDAGITKLRASLSKALPGKGINFEGASDDEQKLLIWAGSDLDPGGYYLFDRTTKQLKRLLLSRSQLGSVALSTVQPVIVAAADGTPIPAYLTLPPGGTGKNLPALVMPHGGPSYRDEWGFDWLAQYFANRGYAVIQPNFRGSSGYGDAWFKENGFKSWRTAVGDITDAGRWLIKQGIADPARLGTIGWSYGGYAALQSNVVAPDLFKAIVAIAPVTDLNDLREQYRDTTAFVEVSKYIGDGPHIIEGSPVQNVSAFRAPVMMFHGELDTNVYVSESKSMDGRLRAAGKSSELTVYPGLDHNLDDAVARADVLRRSDAFLRASMGIK